MTTVNLQCDCGLCCGTKLDMYAHWKATGHGSYKEVTVEKLVNTAIHQLEGLRTFRGKC